MGTDSNTGGAHRFRGNKQKVRFGKNDGPQMEPNKKTWDCKQEGRTVTPLAPKKKTGGGLAWTPSA